MQYGSGYIWEVDKDGHAQPFFPKTRAKDVFTSGAKNVETELNDKIDTIVFDTLDEYKNAYNAGEIPEGTMCIVKGNINSGTSAGGALSKEVEALRNIIGDTSQLSSMSDDGTIIGALKKIQESIANLS